ncbi:MAG: glycyl-radical enzyme activating protein [Bacteroidetes bacterium]|nr:glycyl-radical enzyme activating protein [Bacteroidota bacterium]
MKGLVFDIKHFAIHDGPGLRTTVFLKGCPMKCLWCHNPESQKMIPEEHEKLLTIEDRVYREKISTGQWMTPDEVMLEIRKDEVFYNESDGGVTLSGGEPMMQPDFSLELLEMAHSEGFHTAVDTCGYAHPEVFQRFLEHTDLFLFDLKIMDFMTHVRYTGVSNQNILDNLNALRDSGHRVIIRFPVIPGITNTEDNILKIREFLGKDFTRLDILPYHHMASAKYKRLGLTYALPDLKAPEKNEIESLKVFFSETGINVQTGG